MSLGYSRSGNTIADAIEGSRLTIYNLLDEYPELFYEISGLEELLRSELIGNSWPYPNRTRAKIAKATVSVAMGYPVPKAFKKTKPRFPGQDLDVYVQKSDNLQICNEPIAPARRYVIVRMSVDDIVADVRVMTGEALAEFDRTGTQTKKYQASRRVEDIRDAVPYTSDTDTFKLLLQPISSVPRDTLSRISPTARPSIGTVFTIEALREQLNTLIGKTIDDPGHDQERLRGELLHRLICQILGLGAYADRGQFPDIRCQALEVKLQTAQTIDLGLESIREVVEWWHEENDCCPTWREPQRRSDDLGG